MKVLLIVILLSTAITTESQCLCAAMTNDNTKCPCLSHTQLAQADTFWIRALKTYVESAKNNLTKPSQKLPSYYSEFKFSKEQAQCYYLKYLLTQASLSGITTLLKWGCYDQPSNTICSLANLSSQLDNVSEATKPVMDVNCCNSMNSSFLKGTPWQQLVKAIDAIKLS